MLQTASAPVEPPAPKKEEGFKLNFKFDFTKVNFKKKAQAEVCGFSFVTQCHKHHPRGHGMHTI